MTKPQRKADTAVNQTAASSAAIPLPQRAITALRSLLSAELVLYEKYLVVLAEERKASIGKNLLPLQALQEQRALLTERINEARLKRDTWKLQWLPDFSGTLREWAAASVPSAELSTLGPLLERVRSQAETVVKANREYRVLLDFSLNLVGGCLSLLWSATHNVVRSYSRQGTVHEASNPRSSRLASQLRQA